MGQGRRGREQGALACGRRVPITNTGVNGRRTQREHGNDVSSTRTVAPLAVSHTVRRDEREGKGEEERGTGSKRERERGRNVGSEKAEGRENCVCSERQEQRGFKGERAEERKTNFEGRREKTVCWRPSE